MSTTTTQSQSQSLVAEVAANAARSLRGALADWAYEVTRTDLLAYWRSGLAKLYDGPLPTGYQAFLEFCEWLAGERSALPQAA